MMIDRIWAAMLSVALIAGTPVAAARNARTADDRQPLNVRDLVRLERMSDLAAAPDGRLVAYSLRATDLEANKGRSAIWVLDTRKRAAAPQRLTDLAANAAAPAWSADGRFLYYLSNRSGTNQVWRVDLQQAPVIDSAQQVTNLPLEVGSFRLSPQSDRLLVSLEVFVDCRDLACTTARLEAAAKAPAHGQIYDRLFVRHWDSWSDGRRSHLFVLPLDAMGKAGAAPTDLCAGLDGDVPGKPFGGREDYAWSPDGRNVAFAMRAGTVSEPWSTNFDIYQVPAAGGVAVNLTGENPATDAQPAYSPDGSQLAYLAMDRAGFEADRLHLVLLDLNSRVKRPLTQGWDRSISGYAWSPDGRTLVATADHLGQRPLWAIDAASGRTAAITGDGEVESFTVASSRIFYTLSTLGSPADLFSVGFAGGKAAQLSHLNQGILSHRRLGAYEQFNFPGWNGENVFGYVVKPAEFKSGKQYPVAFMVHGGPQGSLANVWHWRWNAQTLAGAGYGVVMIDFHGSTGYGQAFTDSISGDWGGKPLDDLKLGLAAALKNHPWLDGNRVCALGGSYGGYMMNWIEGQWPDRFKCIVSHDGIFDNRTMYYSTEELWFPEWENGGPEYAKPAAYAKHNPVDLVDRWKTPMLVIHGQLDYRVPYEQGLAAYTALQRRGVPSELLYFPDENHWVLKPQNSIQWYDTVIAWLDRWTRP